MDALDRQVRAFEQQMQTAFTATPEIALLMTLPGIGFTLAVVTALEVGEGSRFAGSDQLAASAGTTPRGDLPAREPVAVEPPSSKTRPGGLWALASRPPLPHLPHRVLTRAHVFEYPFRNFETCERAFGDGTPAPAGTRGGSHG